MAAEDRTDLARQALEQVCSGSDPSAAVGVYSPDFHDHVNASEYHGHEGIRQSLGLYQLVFSDGDLQIRVEDQVSEGERVASRWVAEGHNRGRLIRIWGIVISRIAGGEIVEDWPPPTTFSSSASSVRGARCCWGSPGCEASAADRLEQIVLCELRLLCIGCRPPGRHVEQNPKSRCRRERGDQRDGAAVVDRVGGDPGDQAAGDIAHVAPEAVDADRWRASNRGDGIRDSGDQRRVDERCADSERNRGDGRGRHRAIGGRERRERGRL